MGPSYPPFKLSERTPKSPRRGQLKIELLASPGTAEIFKSTRGITLKTKRHYWQPLESKEGAWLKASGTQKRKTTFHWNWTLR